MPRDFCDCGRKLNAFGYCPRHKDKINKPKKETKKRFSGKSSSEFAFNEYK
jgi:hypothetical protein